MGDPTRSVVVVGGGIFGVAAALELSRRGFGVDLVDTGVLPHENASSTDISKVVRMDYGADPFYTELGERALEGWRSWNLEWGEELYHEVGFLMMRRDPMTSGTFEGDGFELLKARGHSLQRISGERLARRFPAWNGGTYPDGYYNPQGGWAESGAVVARLLTKARESGVRIYPTARYARLIEAGSRVRGIVTAAGDELRADLVIVAAGAWTPTLLPELSESLWAVAQPVLHFRPRETTNFLPGRFPVFAADISGTGWYGFPLNEDGILKVANHGLGERVHPDAPREVSPETEARCRKFFRASFADLVEAPLESMRSCLYCDTGNGDFWIDHDPHREGLVVAAGGSGHAFKFAPVLGEIIADVVEHRPNPAAGRFAWRDSGAARSEQARHGG